MRGIDGRNLLGRVRAHFVVGGMAELERLKRKAEQDQKPAPEPGRPHKNSDRPHLAPHLWRAKQKRRAANRRARKSRKIMKARAA